MNSVAFSLLTIPGFVALLLFFIFTYLYEQSRRQYFRAWQWGWGAYTLHYALDGWGYYGGPPSVLFLLGSLLLVAMTVCIFVSTRLMRERFRLRWYDIAISLGLCGLAVWNLLSHRVSGVFQMEDLPLPHYRLEVGIAAVLLYSAVVFYRHARQKGSLAFRLLGISLGMWAALTAAGQFTDPFIQRFGNLGHALGPIPQMLLGIAMVMVLFENERNIVQENALAFSTLGVDARRLLYAPDLVPAMQDILDRLAAPLPTRRALLCIPEQWRTVLPSVQRGFSPELLTRLEKTGVADFISDLAYRRGGFITFRNLPGMPEPLPAFPGDRFQQFREILSSEHIRHVTAVSLQTREHNFGVILFPHAEPRLFGSSNLRLLIGLALQIGLTLENYVVMHDAQRRTKEYELLTEIGQAISSRLNQDEVLLTIQNELGQIFDTSNFFIAFRESNEIRFELEVNRGHILPKRSRRVAQGLTEYILRTGQPLLIRSDMQAARERIGITYVPQRPAKSFCAAPIFLGGKPAGVMAAMSLDREYVFEQRDLEVMQTAAGQVSVAVENARLFEEEKRRSQQLAFLNNISKTAISSEGAEQMMTDIVSEIQQNFRFDHIGIGILDYVTKEVEIRAEAGTTRKVMGKRIPLGTGIVGRVARTGETALVQKVSESALPAVLPESKAVLCIPITYSETLLGILNVESERENAFSNDDVLILKTLADLLATALHNSFVFQKLQQQSITDGLTGVKTRRFFWESLSSESRRASRTGRPFSVILMDMDKFKEVNDSNGHLEGDLVLARVGRLLEQKSRQSNVVARYGGDEFVILLPETGIEQAQILAERLRLWVATDPMLSEHQITGSFGVASYPVHGFSAEEIIGVADAGMYISKRAGGNRVSIAEQFAENESYAVQRQLISGYIEGFLQREHTGPEHMEELVSTLRKMAGEGDPYNLHILREAIEALNRAAEMRELHGAGHGEQVSHYAQLMGRALGLAPDDVTELGYAARVHDVGKIFIPERILNKSGPLTDEEYYLVKMHSRVGCEILATIPGSRALQDAVLHHHEAFDGSGYPSGLSGEQIPLGARIVCISDAYANMISDRSFAPAKTSVQAVTELEKHSGTKFDGMLVRVLARELKMERSPVNSD